MRLNDTTIKRRLFFNALILLLILSVSLGIYIYALEGAHSAFQGVLDIEHAVNDQAMAIGRLFQKARREENDFRLIRDRAIATRALTDLAAISVKAEAIRQYSNKIGDNSMAALARQVKLSTRDYQKLLRRVIANYEHKGDRKSVV